MAARGSGLRGRQHICSSRSAYIAASEIASGHLSLICLSGSSSRGGTTKRSFLKFGTTSKILRFKIASPFVPRVRKDEVTYLSVSSSRGGTTKRSFLKFGTTSKILRFKIASPFVPRVRKDEVTYLSVSSSRGGTTKRSFLKFGTTSKILRFEIASPLVPRVRKDEKFMRCGEVAIHLT
ncbi:hypothetical protein M8998_14515 [Sphingobacterium sp. lm-10]|uniref:hypothetical protein n=1 Tax=Sphingobacterium sp. lm-10 TaxID=2944904 RepID=UPI00201FF339|nr:hypothetical protein [Sphingobacterium sp. lm-10]MCL7989159.1 hypothetical protein [Sphingobacterium sp. lm-10]